MAGLLLTLVYHDEGGGAGLYRRYQHVTVAPFHPTSGTVVYFQFENTFEDDITLTFRLTNTKYQAVLLYTQNFQPTRLIQKHVNIPGYVFDQGISQLTLLASRAGFSSSVTLMLYPRVHYAIEQFNQPFLSGKTISRIDELGIIRYDHEQLTFTNMGSVQWFAHYGRFDWTSMTIAMDAYTPQDISFISGELWLQDHPSLEGLSYVNGRRQIPLELSLVGRQINIKFTQLYVHPTTMAMSSIPVVGYVPTRTLFFPKAAYRDLKQHPMQLVLKFSQFHEYTIDYAFLYRGEGPWLGHCWESKYCVRTYA